MYVCVLEEPRILFMVEKIYVGVYVNVPTYLHTYLLQITGPWTSMYVYDIPSPFNGSTLMAYTGR